MKNETGDKYTEAINLLMEVFKFDEDRAKESFNNYEKQRKKTRRKYCKECQKKFGTSDECCKSLIKSPNLFR